MTLHEKAHDAVVVAFGIAMVLACDGKSTDGIDQARANDARDGGDGTGNDDSDGNNLSGTDGGDGTGNGGSAGNAMGGSAGTGGSDGSGGGAVGSEGGSAGTLQAPAAPTTPTGGMTRPPPEGVTTWDAEECHVPPVIEPSDPALQELWALARNYCLSIEEQGCLLIAMSESRASLENCTADEQVDACITDVLGIRQNQILPECDAAWRDSIECGTTATIEDSCASARIDFPYGPAEACGTVSDTLLECVTEYSTWAEVTGTYAYCSYGPGASNGECEVVCRSPDHFSELQCSGAEGLPMRCSCSINGHPLNEGSTIYGWVESIYVSDCEDAATQAAAGLCSNRVDCCFEYFDGVNQVCYCGPNPEPLGFDTCEALASYAEGQVVDICPQWADAPGSCWPPATPPCNL